MTDSDGVPEVVEDSVTKPMVAKQKEDLLDVMLPIDQGRVTRELSSEEILALVDLMRKPTRDLERMDALMTARRASR